MRQIVITEANNGYIIEVREHQNVTVFVETSNAKVIKLLKSLIKVEEVKEDPPF